MRCKAMLTNATFVVLEMTEDYLGEYCWEQTVLLAPLSNTQVSLFIPVPVVT